MSGTRNMEIFLTHSTIIKKFDISKCDNIPYTGKLATREMLAELFAELGFTKGAEVGVREGIYSEILCKANPNLELLCIDPWEPTFTYTPRKVRRLYKETRERLAPYNAKLIKNYSLEVVRDIPDGSLDFVYIDALHEFDPVIMDIIHWTPKVRRGGIVSGHDFCYFQNGGVIYAVEAYIRAHNINPWYLTGQDREPSWLWVRD